MTWRTWCGVSASLTALAVLPACVAHSSHPAPGSTSRTPTTTAIAATPAAPAAVTPATRTKKWIDLAVGDCLADLPPTDPSVLTVAIVGCAAPHHAEAYFRAPVPVNAAIAEVANQRCATRFPQYSGQSLGGSPYMITYLIDSTQDRTSANPTPSTVICLLQGSNSQVLTGSARR